MEHVVALRYQTQRFVVFELVQANGALKRALTDLQLLHVGVRKSREGQNYLRCDTTCGGASSRRVGEREIGVVDGSRAIAEEDGEEYH
jgi:hypothetical protein